MSLDRCLPRAPLRLESHTIYPLCLCVLLLFDPSPYPPPAAHLRRKTRNATENPTR